MPGAPGLTRPYPTNCWIVPLDGSSTPPRRPPAVSEWSRPMLGMAMRTALDVGVPTDAPPGADPCEEPEALARGALDVGAWLAAALDETVLLDGADDEAVELDEAAVEVGALVDVLEGFSALWPPLPHAASEVTTTNEPRTRLHWVFMPPSLGGRIRDDARSREVRNRASSTVGCASHLCARGETAIRVAGVSGDGAPRRGHHRRREWQRRCRQPSPSTTCCRARRRGRC